MSKDTEAKAKFVELRAKGYSYDRIARELNVSKQTLITWSRQFELEISNLRAIELESLQEKFLFTRKQRIELLGEFFKKVKAELESRDLKDVPSKDLLTMLLKCLEFLKADTADVAFREEQAFNLDLGAVKSWTG